MGIEFWLIPIIAVAVIGVLAFWLVIRFKGGSGERQDGRTLSDEPAKDEPAKVEWNYYGKP